MPIVSVARGTTGIRGHDFQRGNGALIRSSPPRVVRAPHAGRARERGWHTTREDAQHPRIPTTGPCNTRNAGNARTRGQYTVARGIRGRAGIAHTRGVTHDRWGRTPARTRAHAGSARKRAWHTTRAEAQHLRIPTTGPCNTRNAGNARSRRSYAVARVLRTRGQYAPTPTPTPTATPHPPAAPWHRYGSGSAFLASLAFMPVAVSRSTMSGRMSSTSTDSVSSDPGSTASGDSRRATSVRCSRAWS